MLSNLMIVKNNKQHNWIRLVKTTDLSINTSVRTLINYHPKNVHSKKMEIDEDI